MESIIESLKLPVSKVVSFFSIFQATRHLQQHIAKEIVCINTQKAAAHSHQSLTMKYSLVDISLLLELVVLVRNGCKYCNKNGILRVHSLNFKGACLELKLVCEECGNPIFWNSSLQYPDKSFQVNRDTLGH
jgi:hypothetical protein